MFRGLLNWFRWGSFGARFPDEITSATLTMAAAERTVTVTRARRTTESLQPARTVTYMEES